MSITVPYHGLSTTSHVRWSVLGWPYIGLWSLYRWSTSSRQLIVWQSGQIDFTNSPPMMRHPAPTNIKITMQCIHLNRRCDIWYLLASKSLCSAYISKCVSKNRPNSLKLVFLVKCVIRQSWVSKVNFLKFHPFRKRFKNRFTTSVL